MTEFIEQGASSRGMQSGGTHDHSWRTDIEMDEEEDEIDKASAHSENSSDNCSQGSSAYSCSTSGSSRTCSSSSASSKSSPSTCSCSVSEETEFDPRADLPYPSYVPVSWYCLEQTTRPRNWCLWLISNPYPLC